MIEMQINPRILRKRTAQKKWLKDNFKSKDNSGFLALTISF